MKVLVATDGSSAGEAAVRFASALLAGFREGELFVLTVETDRDREKSSTSVSELARQSAGLGIRARRIVARVPVLDEVPEVICRQADRIGANLVVVGSEGRDTLEDWAVGGTALRLLYLSRRPVTVVRAPRRRGLQSAGRG